MTVSASTLIAASSTPTQDDVWSLAHLMTHNWASPFTMRTSWQTSAATSRSDAEKRFGLMSKPYRSMDFSLTGMSRSDMRALRTLLTRTQYAKSLWPIYSDVIVNPDVSAPPVITKAPTGFKYTRFYIGGRAVLANIGSGSNRITQFQIITIADAGDSFIESAEAFDGWVTAAGARLIVMPLMECEVGLLHTMNALNDSAGTAGVTVMEAVGRSALNAWAAGNDSLTADFEQYRTLPVLDMAGDWTDNQISITRSGDQSGLGLGFNFEIYGSRPRQGAGSNFIGVDRLNSWRLLRLFDSRRGRLYPMYCLDPTTLFQIVALSATEIHVTAEGYERDWQDITHLFLRTNTGFIVRKIASVLRNGSVDEVTIAVDDDPITLSANDVKQVGSAFLGRFDSDEIEESWITNHLVSVKLSVTELYNEKDVEAALL